MSQVLPSHDQAEPVLQPQQRYYGLTLSAWIQIGTIALLLALVFWPNLRRLWLKTNPVNGEANWGHAIFVPLIGLYYLYLNREQLLKLPVKAAWSGLPIVLGGLFLFGYGIYPGQNDFVKDVGMVVCLFGVVAMLCGWAIMRIAWFPVVFLLVALPWPGLVYTMVAIPLQEMAATAGVYTMKLTGVETYQFGTKIEIHAGGEARTLNVAEACAGIKSLMTFVAVAAAVGFLSSRPLWQKLFIVASAVPIAIFCNMMRVAGQGLLDTYVSRSFSESFAHQFVGMIMLIPAFFLILLVAWILDNMFVDEVDARSKRAVIEARRRGSAPAKAAALGVPSAQPAKVADAVAEQSPAAAGTDDLAAATLKLMSAGRRSARPAKKAATPDASRRES